MSDRVSAEPCVESITVVQLWLGRVVAMAIKRTRWMLKLHEIRKFSVGIKVGGNQR